MGLRATYIVKAENREITSSYVGIALAISGDMNVSVTVFRTSVATLAAAMLLGGGVLVTQPRLAAQGEVRTIEVVAERFTFEPSRIEVSEGERVKLVVRSADGVHGVEIKKFKVSKKVPRGGEPVEIEFVASAAGEYPILCSEYCGKGHEDMKGTLVVVAK